MNLFLHFISGDIYTVADLDFEAEESYVLYVTATDSSDTPLFGECVVNINVEDINDNVPKFNANHYKVSLQSFFKNKNKDIE